MKKLSLLVALFITASMVLVSCGGSTKSPAKEAVAADASAKTAVVEKAAPVKKEVAAVDYENGKAIYNKMCNVCHGAGVAGAAKLDNKARWEATAAKGLETVDNNAIKGFKGEYGVMPPKGGGSFTDDEVKEAVAYMLHEAGVTAK